ncbi:MAG: hypothetical protein HND47_22040 [Chloroflexi bacterium]|nr:hypothetical protein [Chloroflexota bacterium]
MTSETRRATLGVANALFIHYAQKLTVSRLQRDLSDSTVRRTFGTALGHSLLAWTQPPARDDAHRSQRGKTHSGVKMPIGRSSRKAHRPSCARREKQTRTNRSKSKPAGAC